jgi:Ca2+-binding RTX toxin-like protein
MSLYEMDAQTGGSIFTSDQSLQPFVDALMPQVDESPSYLSSCGCPSCRKATDAFYTSEGGFQIIQTPTQLLAAAAIADGPNNTAATARALTVGGDRVFDTINRPGDVDVYKVSLVAGQTYEFGLYMKAGLAPPQGSGVPLPDAYLELFDSSGKLVGTADGGGPNTPSGLDALLGFKATVSGDYFLHARSYDQDTTNNTAVGGPGDTVGDYEVFARAATANRWVYTPFYSFDSPLHSLDWGSEFRRSSRNPDGDNGTRTDNGVPNTGEMMYDFRTGIEGKNVVTYYFAKPGEVYTSPDPTTPGITTDIVQARTITDFERQQYRLALSEFEKVADIIYIEVDNRVQADLKIITYNGTPGPGASVLGRASAPGEESEGQLEYNAGDYRYTDNGITQGGFFFPTILHEFGHAHGIAHPHDEGGRSSVMRGAGGSTTSPVGGAYGDFGLSQGVFTMMSYNKAWPLRPDGTPSTPSVPVTQTPDQQPNYGHVGTLAALDIAVIQDKYGVNEEYNRGDDVYQLKDVNQKGTFYATIWDGGGNDTIRYDGVRDGVIDLRAATLKYEEGGGGWVSYYKGIFGGFTIANGVVIENAIGGDGKDVITGNSANNTLLGGGGDDIISGGDGADTINGNLGNDTINGNLGDDLIYGGQGNDFVMGGQGNDTLFGSMGDDVLLGGLGADILDGNQGADVFLYLASSHSTPEERDVINNFEIGVDKIDLRSMRSGPADVFQIISSGSFTILNVDLGGDGGIDLQIALAGNPALTTADLIV